MDIKKIGVISPMVFTLRSLTILVTETTFPGLRSHTINVSHNIHVKTDTVFLIGRRTILVKLGFSMRRLVDHGKGRSRK